MPLRPAPNNAGVDFDLSDLANSHVAFPSYNELIDSVTTAGFTYFCEAPIGTALSAAGWRISRLEDATGKLMWADGNAKFDNVADDRATITYSF